MGGEDWFVTGIRVCAGRAYPCYRHTGTLLDDGNIDFRRLPVSNGTTGHRRVVGHDNHAAIPRVFVSTRRVNNYSSLCTLSTHNKLSPLLGWHIGINVALHDVWKRRLEIFCAYRGGAAPG